MNGKLIFTSFFVLVLAGCGGGGGSEGQQSSVTNDVSTTPLAAQTSEQSPAEAISSVIAVVSPVKVDLENRQVFLPNMGWLSEDAFWDIYFNEPQKLPDNIDFDEIHKLGYREQSPDAASGDNS